MYYVSRIYVIKTRWRRVETYRRILLYCLVLPSSDKTCTICLSPHTLQIHFDHRLETLPLRSSLWRQILLYIRSSLHLDSRRAMAIGDLLFCYGINIYLHRPSLNHRFESCLRVETWQSDFVGFPLGLRVAEGWDQPFRSLYVNSSMGLVGPIRSKNHPISSNMHVVSVKSVL